MASREKQSVYQKKFENDVNRYNSSGNRKGSSEGSTPSGEAGLLKGDKTCMVVDEVVSATGLMMTMSMLKQASSKSWLSLKLWLLEFDIVVRGKGCKKFEQKLHGNMGDHGCRF